MNEWIKNENMQLKLLELAFYRKCSMKKMIFFHLEKNDGKKPRKVCVWRKASTLPNYVQLNLTSSIFNEKRSLSVS